MRETVIVGLLAASAQVVAAAPPACLLAAVNTQPDPSDLSAVCSGSNATEVKQYISNHCGNNVSAAMSAFSSVCNSAGSSATISSTGTGTAAGSSPTSTSSPGVAAREGIEGTGIAIVGLLGALLAL